MFRHTAKKPVVSAQPPPPTSAARAWLTPATEAHARLICTSQSAQSSATVHRI